MEAFSLKPEVIYQQPQRDDGWPDDRQKARRRRGLADPSLDRAGSDGDNAREHSDHAQPPRVGTAHQDCQTVEHERRRGEREVEQRGEGEVEGLVRVHQPERAPDRPAAPAVDCSSRVLLDDPLGLVGRLAAERYDVKGLAGVGEHGVVLRPCLPAPDRDIDVNRIKS